MLVFRGEIALFGVKSVRIYGVKNKKKLSLHDISKA